MTVQPVKKKRKRARCRVLCATDLVYRAVSASKDRKGMSFVPLKKELAGQGYDVELNVRYIKKSVKQLLANGSLVQMRGTGASGSYKVNKKVEKAKTGKSSAEMSSETEESEKAEDKRDQMIEVIIKKEEEEEEEEEALMRTHEICGAE
ncbi:histone H1.5-like [Plectropomus leopardus]|uniref:histone H1.5-like n=1 Tax=Plectropomus leopardus TaxID=160734 RepID=UPI001C4CE7EC|nr:histone H1.5-like [Plectropomus leopardus]